MIVSTKTRRVAVLNDEPTATYAPERVEIDRRPASGASAAAANGIRATVELIRLGGVMPRALLGGSFTPGTGDLVLEVGVIQDQSEREATCTSQLHTPLVPGLPTEYASGVLNGLARISLPSGRLTIDRAGYDLAGSSPMAFELTAELLATALSALTRNDDVEAAVRKLLQAQP